MGNNNKALIEKFERDMQKRSWINRIMLVTDQWLNVCFWNGSQDETISSHIGRKIEANRANWFEKILCKCLEHIESMHCKKSKGE